MNYTLRVINNFRIDEWKYFCVNYMIFFLLSPLSFSLAPTEVSSLMLDRSSDTSFNVIWSLPAMANGVIRNYTVLIRYYGNMAIVKSDATTSDTQSSIDQLSMMMIIIIIIIVFVYNNNNNNNNNLISFRSRGTLCCVCHCYY